MDHWYNKFNDRFPPKNWNPRTNLGSLFIKMLAWEKAFVGMHILENKSCQDRTKGTLIHSLLDFYRLEFSFCPRPHTSNMVQGHPLHIGKAIWCQALTQAIMFVLIPFPWIEIDPGNPSKLKANLNAHVFVHRWLHIVIEHILMRRSQLSRFGNC